MLYHDNIYTITILANDYTDSDNNLSYNPIGSSSDRNEKDTRNSDNGKNNNTGTEDATSTRNTSITK